MALQIQVTAGGARIERSKTAINVIEYKCAKCKELDHLKLYDTEPAPPVVNCWNCHAGLRQDPATMIQKQLGMFQTGNNSRYVPALS